MTNTNDKMKLRADLMLILNKYRDAVEFDNVEVNNDIDYLLTFQDKEYICKTLFKEMGNENTQYGNVCAIFAIEVIDDETFKKEAFSFLNDKDESDDKKFFIASLMKQKGIEFDTSELEKYISNPEKYAKSSVSRFLFNALEDPEVQIDLLDFYSNIDIDERLYLLDNLINEFKGDDLANALAILAQLELQDEEIEYILNGLLMAKSPFAIDGLKHLIVNYDFDKKIQKQIIKEIKTLEKENPDFVNDSIVKNSRLSKCYMSFIDGKSNFTLVITRIRKSGKYDVFLNTINVMLGITSCIGFGSIDKVNCESIISRIFADTIPNEVPPEIFRALNEYYYSKNIKNNVKIPYEYIVWKKLLTDIAPLKIDVSEALNRDLKITPLTEKKVIKIIKAKVIESWYWNQGENKYIDALIKNIENNHLTKIEEIEKIISDVVEDGIMQDKELLLEMQSRLLIQSYAANLAGLNTTSSCLYSLCHKNPYVKLFFTSIVDKSLYCYFEDVINVLEGKEVNIFRKNFKTSFKIDELRNILLKFEEKWK